MRAAFYRRRKKNRRLTLTEKEVVSAVLETDSSEDYASTPKIVYDSPVEFVKSIMKKKVNSELKKSVQFTRLEMPKEVSSAVVPLFRNKFFRVFQDSVSPDY